MGMKPKAIEGRFWPQVDKSGECWIWTGYTSAGYGRIFYKGKSNGVHRLAYELEYGEIPEGMDVCHNCPNNQDNPLCVRPDHLWLGTHEENMHDRDKKGRAFITYGERSGMHKLNDADVIQIRQLKEQGMKQRHIAEIFDVAPTNISFIVNRVTWTHI